MRRAEADRRGPDRAALGLLSAVIVVLAVLFGTIAGAGAIVLPEADLRLSGAVVEGPDGGGIDTGSTMRYLLTVRNDGPSPIPARGLLLVVSVDRSDSSELATMEVVRFTDGGALRPAVGGQCGNGSLVQLRCTNGEALASGAEITLDIGHRHPVLEAGTLSFVADASIVQQAINDPVPANNGYRGPNYQFRNQPSTSTTPTTDPNGSSTTDPNSSSTTDPNSSSTTVESTTSSSSTTTTSTTSTTVATTTSTTEEPTTLTQTSLAALSGSATLPGGPTTSLAGTETSNDQLVLGQSGDGPSSDGPPYVLLVALAALVLVLGGIAVAGYAHLNRPPPLVDMRRFD